MVVVGGGVESSFSEKLLSSKQAFQLLAQLEKLFASLTDLSETFTDNFCQAQFK